MARIKIDDLPEDMKVSKEQMRKVVGGVEPTSFPMIPSGGLTWFGAGKSIQGITGVNFKVGTPIQNFPGSHWKVK